MIKKILVMTLNHITLQVMKMVQTTVQREGVTSLWRGVGVTLLRDVPFSAVYWACYEDFKVRLDYTRQHRPRPFFPPMFSPMGASLLAAASSGSRAAILTFPFDVIKTQQQAAFGQAG